jgi:hypothetical protein
MRCCARRWRFWPSGAGLRGQASNRPELRWLKTVVVSVRERRGLITSGGDQEDVPERREGREAEPASPLTRRNRSDGIKTRGFAFSPGMSLADTRLLARWCPAYRRREPGLLLLHGT